MQDKTENTKRLARNTMFLYFRSIFCLVLQIYSSRLFLHALGVDDYGINNAVAGFASMFTLVTGSLSSAISRFLIFEQGTGNTVRQKQVFAIALNLMITFALIIFLLSQTFGTWFVQHKMTIPPGREIAAIWAFRCAVLTVMTGLIIAPFNSSILAHEKMDLYAYISIAEAIMRLGMALFLTFGAYTLDRLILYTLLSTLCTLLLQGFTIAYTAIHFQECRFKLYFDKKLTGELFGYAGWNFIGNVSGTLSGQGVNMLINIFCGPAVNAARGLSNTVSRSIGMFVNNFMTAIGPQITKAYAAKDMPYVKYLTYRGSRFAFYIMFLLSLPVILEADFVFTLWLGDVPEHTVNFNRLSLIGSLIGLFYSTFGMVQMAAGDIKKFNLWLSLFTLFQFPLSWVFLKLGFRPEIVYVVVILTTLCTLVAVLEIVRGTLHFQYKELIREIYIPELKVILCSSIPPLASIFLLPYGWPRFLVTGTLCVLFTVPSILFLGCNASERLFILNAIRKKLSPNKK